MNSEKKPRPFPAFTVSEKGEKMRKGGHLWVYKDELTYEERDGISLENGCIADLFGKKGNYLGSGFYNGNSKIALRILSENANDRYDDDFFRRRVFYALDYRKKVMGDDFRCCRLIFGESDGIPGLTVDRFGDVLVSEVLSLGTDMRKDVIYKALCDGLMSMGEKISVIYERNEGELRTLEGMEKYSGFYQSEGLLCETNGHTVINENGILFDVDYINGQKTGYFLDQKYNRAAIRRIAKDSTVLDVCTHTGAFALNAARGGCKSVTALDVSAFALEEAKKNAGLNGITNISFVRSDMFAFLEALVASKKKTYDFIILDPPAFTKSNDTFGNAYKGYLRLNTLAMRALPRGGYLATCSCSHFMRDRYFCEMLRNAASSAGVSLMQIEGRQQSCDHPILWNMPETDYLKFYIFRVI